MTKKEANDKVSNLIRTSSTSEELRYRLMDEITAIQEGNANSERGRTVARLADKILRSLQLDIEAQSFVSRLITNGSIRITPLSIAAPSDIAEM